MRREMKLIKSSLVLVWTFWFSCLKSMPFTQPIISKNPPPKPKTTTITKKQMYFSLCYLLWYTSYSVQKDNYRTKQSSEMSYWDDEVWKHYYTKVKKLQLFSVETNVIKVTRQKHSGNNLTFHNRYFKISVRKWGEFKAHKEQSCKEKHSRPIFHIHIKYLALLFLIT